MYKKARLNPARKDWFYIAEFELAACVLLSRLCVGQTAFDTDGPALSGGLADAAGARGAVSTAGGLRTSWRPFLGDVGTVLLPR